MTIANDEQRYKRQGFGAALGVSGRIGLLIVDFVVGFADPDAFGGGNIREAIAATVPVLAEARRRGWPVAHTRIVFADDAGDHNIFAAKVPTLLALTETAAGSAIVPELTPVEGELVVRKTVPSAFFETGLRSWLTQRGVETLLIAGTTTSGCVRASVIDAMSCGFKPVVLEDCVGDRALGPHESNLFDMGQKNADVLRFAGVLAQLS
ncbi:isochorismatase family protein [Caballeronia sp. 15715]|uniref:isochorismatase family protein n=1 Tax=Caballeronia sp. 15715 TaxID=3391030 RepID=UPI0039E60155